MFVFALNMAFAQAEGRVKGWPHMYPNGGHELVVHQPQSNKWSDDKLLHGKAGRVLELKGEGKAYYGAANLQAATGRFCLGKVLC
jgi:hypothetical protein